MQKAIIICIGDELLIGQTVDTNSVWIGRQLNNLGIEVIRKYAISDKLEDIQNTLRHAQSDADLIIITGGLGPTKDDITKKALADYFGGKLIRNEVVFQHVKKFFEKRNRPLLPVNEQQADVPDNCEVLFNTQGTAPGMLFIQDQKWIISLPGVPNEVKSIMQEEVLPRLSAKVLRSHHHILHKTLLLFGRGESFVARDIEDIENSLPPNIQLAYLPHYSELRLRLSGTGTDAFDLSQKVDIYYNLIATRLEDYLVATLDISLQEAVVQYFIKNRLTISTAESCTGGLADSLITEIPGSSAAYLGSIVAYHNDIKHQIIGVSQDTLRSVGAVSKDTVEEMSTNTRAKFRSDYSLALSGILGPDGDTERKPVGTVWIDIAGPNGVYTHKLELPWNNRLINKEMAAKWGLYLLLRTAQKDLAQH